MNWQPLPFGRHEGLTLPQILLKDPDWFFWAYNEGVFKGRTQAEADKIYKQARSIKIPGNENGQLEVEYLIHQPTGKFGTFEVVPADRPLHVGGSPAYRRDRVDMHFPREFKGYDKTGYKLFIKCMKHYLFGNESARLSREKCEAFFDNDDNFIS